MKKYKEPLELINIDCSVCDNESFTVFLPSTLGNDPPIFGYKWTPEVSHCYRMVRCLNCGHVRASPLPRDMYKYYEDNVDEAYLAASPLRTATAIKVLERIQQYVPQGDLLDVGCATGDFLIAAKKFYRVKGLELSAWSRDYALAKNLDVLPLLLCDIENEGEKYDVVTLWGVIEHLERPSEELDRIYKILRPGGIVCLWTGDVDSFLARLFQAKWWYVMGQHIQLFSRSSLDKALKNAGFNPTFKGVYPYVISFGYLGKSFARYPYFGSIISKLMNAPFIKEIKFTLLLPDEIFYVYRK